MGYALGPCAQAGLAIQRSFFAIAKNVRMPSLIRGSTRRLRRHSMQMLIRVRLRIFERHGGVYGKANWWKRVFAHFSNRVG